MMSRITSANSAVSQLSIKLPSPGSETSKERVAYGIVHVATPIITNAAKRSNTPKSISNASGICEPSMQMSSLEELNGQSNIQIQSYPSMDLPGPAPTRINTIDRENSEFNALNVRNTYRPKLNDEIYNPKEVDQLFAARIIEKAWFSHRDRQMFKMLKHAICAAESSLSYEILRKVAPNEANFLKDKCMTTKVRFRFGGCEFPPLIFFKVFTSSSASVGSTVKYISGKKMIQPSSEAARDACNVMGNKKYLEQVLQDIVHQESHRITDESDVTTVKDYMQYLSLLDETPSYLGGKDNSWRRLTLEDLPRHTIFYDVVEFLYSKKLTPKLQNELPKLLVKPLNQEMQIEHMRIISELRSPSPSQFLPSPKLRLPTRLAGRRTMQAKSRIAKMRKLYSKEKTPDVMKVDQPSDRFDEMAVADENWEEEADKLYEWTQELSFEDLMTTPRLNTANISPAVMLH